MKNLIIFILFFVLLFGSFLYASPTPFIPEDAIIKLAKEFVTDLKKNNFLKAAENFDSTMKNVMPSEKLKEVWAKVVSQVGSFQKQKSGTVSKN